MKKATLMKLTKDESKNYHFMGNVMTGKKLMFVFVFSSLWFGVLYPLAMMAFVLLLGVFAAVIGAELHHQGQLQTAIDAYNEKDVSLKVSCIQVRDDILTESDGVLVRQKALQLGMIDSAGVQVRTLQEPQDADITLAEQALPYTLASIWGQ